MIEISFVDLVLIVISGLACAGWASAREDARVAKKMLVLFIENPEARKQIIEAHEKFLRENQ